ncbi:MAG TPA: hypothetical protein VFT22_10895 [Kofleriaceae bacterium]|nr:hypothetical protein [Kofleriaceae bacterium]
MSVAAERIQEASEATLTEWYNPLDVPQVVRVLEDGRWAKFTVPSKQKRLIPTKYDRVIQSTNRDLMGNKWEEGGAVIVLGGVAPQLVNMSLPEHDRPKLHEGLDTEYQKLKLVEEELAAAEVTRRAAEGAQIIAAAKLEQKSKTEKK